MSTCVCRTYVIKAFLQHQILEIKYFSPLKDSGRVWMLMNPKRISFLGSFGFSFSPKWSCSSLISSFRVVFPFKVLMNRMNLLHCPLVQFGSSFTRVPNRFFICNFRCAFLLWGRGGPALLSFWCSCWTEMTFSYIMLFCLQIV